MEIRSAELIVWKDQGSWYWELTVNERYVGEGRRTDQVDAEAVAAWMGSCLETAEGPIGFRVATDEENEKRDADRRYFRRVERENQGLGIVEPRRKKDLMDLIAEAAQQDEEPRP